MTSLQPPQTSQFSTGDRVQYFSESRQKTLTGKILDHNVRGHTYELEIEDRKGAYIRIVPENKIRRIAKRSFPSDYEYASTKAKKELVASSKFDEASSSQSAIDRIMITKHH